MQIAELVTQHYTAVYRVAYRLTGSTQDAEDLTQQAFLDAQRHLPSLREPSRAKAWVCMIVRNLFRQRVRKPEPTTVALEAVGEVADAVPSEGVDRDELQQALNTLPEEFRTVLVLYYFEDLNYPQIAAELGVPIGTVMSRLSRGKQHLRQRLNPERL